MDHNYKKLNKTKQAIEKSQIKKWLFYMTAKMLTTYMRHVKKSKTYYVLLFRFII